MPKSRWLFIVAITGLATGALGQESDSVWYNGVWLECDANECAERLEQRLHEPNQKDGAEPNSNEKAEQPNSLVINTIAGDTESDEADARDKTQREIDDLAAQQSMARWTRRAVVVAGVSLMIAGVGVFLLRRQLNMTRELFVAERRPWLEETLDTRNAAVFAGTPEVRFLLHLRLRNIGQIPAINVHFKKLIETYQFKEDEVADAILAEMRMAQNAPAKAGRSLLPQGETSFRIDFKLEEMGILYKGRTVYICGVVEYMYAGSSEKHFTPFAWMVGGNVENMGEQTGSFTFSIFERVPVHVAPT